MLKQITPVIHNLKSLNIGSQQGSDTMENVLTICFKHGSNPEELEISGNWRMPNYTFNSEGVKCQWLYKFTIETIYESG